MFHRSRGWTPDYQGLVVARKPKKLQPTLFDPFAAAEPPMSAEFHSTVDETQLLALALALDPRSVAGWTEEEERITRNLPRPKPRQVDAARRLIRAGRDPLGTLFCRIRSPERRRSSGATFTPSTIVEAMLDWAQAQATPSRIVDPGSGSGRYLLSAARRFPSATLVGIDVDPVATIMARANLSAGGFADRAQIILGDFRSTTLPEVDGRTLYTGNPPYIRHHLLDSEWKAWLIRESRSRRLHASQLAGLAVRFFLPTVL